MQNAKLTGKRCLCRGCDKVFSTVANFDRHRVGKHGIDRHCAEPEAVGLVRKETATGVLYQMPGKEG